MKAPLGLLAFVVAFAIPGLRVQDAPPLRERHNFNREWRFTLGDVKGGEAPAFDDAKWEDVGLPHSFSMPYFAAGSASTWATAEKALADAASGSTGRFVRITLHGTPQENPPLFRVHRHRAAHRLIVAVS